MARPTGGAEDRAVAAAAVAGAAGDSPAARRCDPPARGGAAGPAREETMHVPPGWPRDCAGRLLAAGVPIETLAEAHGTPLFLYSAPLVEARVAALRAALPAELRLRYAVKANPMPDLLRLMAGLVDGFDIASQGELDLVRAAGAEGLRIGFAGPGKRDGEIEAAIRAGAVLHVESEGELRRASAIARRLGTRARVALRVNPPFRLRGSGLLLGGGASPFGIDAADVPGVLAAVDPEAADFLGFHIFSGSQVLDAAALAEAAGQSLALAAELAASAPGPVRHLVLGGGFGVPYFPADRPLDLPALGAALGPLLVHRPPALAGAEISLELGRYLVAEAGVYVTRILDRKRSCGETFLVTDGGLHHQLAATGNFGSVVRRNYPLALAGPGRGPVEEVHVVGCLCTPLDRLGDRIRLPRAAPGDLVVVFLAGAYGRTASPERFLGHPPPGEILVAPGRSAKAG